MEANQRNAQFSTGPQTARGKEIARANSIKHACTGHAIVLPNEDVEALAAKLTAFEDDLKPRNATEQELVKRFALMAIRLDRMARQEARALSIRMRNAESLFDDAQAAEAGHLISWIASEPITNHRRLLRTRDGLKRLIGAIEGLVSDLLRQPGYLWTYQHCDQLHHSMGMRREEMPITRARALTEAIHGKFENIDPSAIPESEPMAKRRWAIGQMFELMEAELAKLRTLLETFDPASLELDRAEAADRAMFDDSKEGILARKYEAACERAMYKALKELRELQAHSPQTKTEEMVMPESSEELGSSFPDVPADEPGETDADPTIETSEQSSPNRRPNLERLARNGRRRPSST